MRGEGREPIHLLHVTGEGAGVRADLERERPPITVETATGVTSGLEAIETSAVDCVVGDVALPDEAGLDLLGAVRERWPDLPVILSTTEGTGAVARRAIEAGASDCLQVDGGNHWDVRLVRRIETVVGRRRAEADLARNRRRFELLGQASGDAFWDWDLETDRVQRSEGYARIYGLEPGAVDDSIEWWEDRLHPEDEETVRRAANEAMDRGDESYEVDYHVRTADGSYKPVRTSARIVYDDDGDPTRIVGALIDLSDIRARERELAETRERLQLVLEGTETGVWEWDPRTDRLEWDETIEELLGLPDSDFDGTWGAFRERIPEADRDPFELEVERAIEAGGRLSAEFRVRHTEGGLRWVSVEGLVRETDDGAVERLVGLLRDVTERREREEELRRSQRRFRAVFDDPAVFLVLLSPDGTVELANDRAAASLDVDPETVTGGHFTESAWWSHVPAERREEIREGIRRAGEGAFVRVDGLSLAFGEREATIDGHIRPVTDERGEVVSVLMEGIDVSEREERERRIESIHEATGDLVRAEDPESVAAVVTEAAEEILGCPSNVVRLRAEDRLRPVSVSERALAELGERPVYDVGEGMPGRALERGEPILVEDFRDMENFEHAPSPNRSGLYVPIGDHGVLSMGDTEPDAFDRTDVHLAGILASNAAGVLDRLEGEASLRERERQLARQNERLEEFAGVVAHDLRNPLNVATLAAETIPEDVPGVDPLENALARMETLVDDVLALAKQGQAVDDPEPVDLAEAADRAWSMTDTTGGELRVEGNPTVEADPDRLQALLENLFRNAIVHGLDGSEADGTAALTRRSGRGDSAEGVTVSVGALADGFFVEDDGAGFPEGSRDRLFETGYSTREDGTGFGLAIVAEVADAHGWTIEALEGRAGGARVEVHTPG